jgi:hypothetical protein
MDTPRVPKANNPTPKQVMQTKVQIHKKKTQGNTLGALPLIIHPNIIEQLTEQLTEPTVLSTKCLRIMASHTKQAKAGNVVTPRQSTRLHGLKPSAHVQFRNSRIISQEAINLLLTDDINNDLTNFTPLKLQPQPVHQRNYVYYAMPTVHPITGETITSYNKLMKDPVTQETWMTVFGKDFGGTSQGGNKMGQVGTNAMFVMDPKDIQNISADRMVTYANVVVDFRPQKEDRHCIRIMAGGNLINFPGELTMRMATLQCQNYIGIACSAHKRQSICASTSKFFTFSHHSIHTSICASHWSCSPHGSLHNTTC